MNVIKVTLGFLELAFALKFLSVADLAYGSVSYAHLTTSEKIQLPS